MKSFIVAAFLRLSLILRFASTSSTGIRTVWVRKCSILKLPDAACCNNLFWPLRPSSLLSEGHLSLQGRRCSCANSTLSKSPVVVLFSILNPPHLSGHTSGKALAELLGSPFVTIHGMAVWLEGAALSYKPPSVRPIPSINLARVDSKVEVVACWV